MMHGAMAVFLQVILLKGASASDVKITVPAAWMDHMAEFRIELDYTLIKQVYYQLKMVYISSRQMVCMFPVIIQKLNRANFRMSMRLNNESSISILITSNHGGLHDATDEFMDNHKRY